MCVSRREVIGHDPCDERVKVLPSELGLSELLGGDSHGDSDRCNLSLWIRVGSIILACSQDHVRSRKREPAVEGRSRIWVSRGDDVCRRVAVNEEPLGIHHSQLGGECILKLLDRLVLLLQVRPLDVTVKVIPELLQLDETFDHPGRVRLERKSKGALEELRKR